MTSIAKHIVLILIMGGILLSNKSLAAGVAPTDANGDVIISETLALRCGLDSENYEVTEDCINRLAYDYATDKIVNFDSYGDEQNAIIGEYAADYIKMGSIALVDASHHEAEVAKMICTDKKAKGCSNEPSDTRTQLEYNNRLATDNSSLMLSAIKMRSAALNLQNVINLLEIYVPETNTDIKDTSLYGAP